MLFQAITLEGWSFMMYNCQDTNNPAFSVVFFLLLILMGSWFALNLVLGQIMDSWFTEKSKQEQEKKIKIDTESDLDEEENKDSQIVDKLEIEESERE